MIKTYSRFYEWIWKIFLENKGTQLLSQMGKLSGFVDFLLKIKIFSIDSENVQKVLIQKIKTKEFEKRP